MAADPPIAVSRRLVVAVDGPSGSGKSSVAVQSLLGYDCVTWTPGPCIGR